MSRRALAILEGEVESDGLMLGYPLMVLGLGYLDDHMPERALPFLERAVKIRDASESEAALRAEAHFALARALRALGREGDRARQLAEVAALEYGAAADAPDVRRELERLNAWLVSFGAEVPGSSAVAGPSLAD